jgi:integrase
MKSEVLSLSERALNALEARERPYVVADRHTPLKVRIQPSGARAFFIEGRLGRGGKPVKVAIGSTKFVTLADARAEAERLRSLIAVGQLPRSKAQEARDAEREALTVTQALDQYLARREAGAFKAKWRHHERRAKVIRRTLAPWADRPLRSITDDDVRKLFDGFLLKRQFRTARAAHRDANQFFIYSLHMKLISKSPFDGLDTALLVGAEPDARSRVLNDAELVAVWRAVEGVGDPWCAIIRLLILTGCRANEIAQLRWDEIDIKERQFAISAARYKTGVLHVVPLSTLALDIVSKLRRRDRDEPSDPVFRTPNGYPVSGTGWAKAKIDRELAAAGHKLEPWVIHDLRRSYRTGIGNLKEMVRGRTRHVVDYEIAERMIGHAIGAKVGRTYARETKLDVMQDAAEAWADHIRALAGANVVAMPKPKAKPKRRAVEA